MAVRELSKRIAYLRLAIAATGLLASIYLAVLAVFSLAPACPTGQLVNCENVLTSAYSKTFGIPNGFLGIGFFLVVLALVYMRKAEHLALFNAIGIGFVAYYVYAEYLIGSICIYCTLAHVCALALLIISVYELRG